MTIYTRLGAPCEITAVRETRVWRVWRDRLGSWEIERAKPVKLGRHDRIKDEFDLMEVRVRRTGPYPDGSGGAETTADPEWYESGFVVADDGWREISKAIEALKQKEAA